MLAGVGIIGALASILASLLVSPAPAKAEETAGVEAAAGTVPEDGPGSRVSELVLAIRARADP